MNWIVSQSLSELYSKGKLKAKDITRCSALCLLYIAKVGFNWIFNYNSLTNILKWLLTVYIFSQCIWTLMYTFFLCTHMFASTSCKKANMWVTLNVIMWDCGTHSVFLKKNLLEKKQKQNEHNLFSPTSLHIITLCMDKSWDPLIYI